MAKSVLLWLHYSIINFITCDFKVNIRYDYIKKDTGLTQGTNDQAGQDAFNQQKVQVETERTEVQNGLKTVNWVDFKSSSGLELKDYNVDNFDLKPAEAYCSEDGAVVEKCDSVVGACNQDTGSVTKCSKYNRSFIKHDDSRALAAEGHHAKHHIPIEPMHSFSDGHIRQR